MHRPSGETTTGSHNIVVDQHTDLCVAHLRVEEQEEGTGTWNVVLHCHHSLYAQSCHALMFSFRLRRTIEGETIPDQVKASKKRRMKQPEHQSHPAAQANGCPPQRAPG